MKKTLIIITTFCSLVACEKAIDNLPQDSSINKSNQRIAASSPVEFIYDKGRVSSIKMGNVPLLGDAVGTGGIYLIGSLDGSDAQGKSVSSKGATNGFMLPETLNTAIPRPPYSLAFTKISDNTLHFSATVGPVPTDFKTMSMPFDFSKQLMTSFAFNGTSYYINCATNAGVRNTSQDRYDYMRPSCIIRDINHGNVVVGKVAVADTRKPITWGEVISDLATVRVNITKSSHYQNMLFYNHPGTNNLELGFGAMKKGEIASISGEIIVGTPPQPIIFFEAEKDLQHQVGRPEADGWSANVKDKTKQFLCYGPYTRSIKTGLRNATFRLMLDNVTADNLDIATIDVYDANTGKKLVARTIKRTEFDKNFTYKDFKLSFMAQTGQSLEFRTFWHGYSYIRQDKVKVE